MFRDPSLLVNASANDDQDGGNKATAACTVLAMLENLLPHAAEDIEQDATALCNHFATLTRYIRMQDGEIPEEISHAVSSITVHLQFQDRLTQTMNSATQTIRDCRRLDETAGGVDEIQKAEKILGAIRLANIRERYLKTLRSFRMSPDILLSDIQPAPDAIELF